MIPDHAEVLPSHRPYPELMGLKVVDAVAPRSLYPKTALQESTSNFRIQEFKPLLEPVQLKEEYPLTRSAEQTVAFARRTIQAILAGRDHRMLVVVGPCSIHDEVAALEYAQRLAVLSRKVSETLFPVMRTYLEKPRTTVGWKGLINDPQMNGTFDLCEGLRISRRLLLKINEMGLPVATEMLDPSTPVYIGDLVAWSAIGARTTESQTHREMASGLPMPVGFKNSTDGRITPALNAIQAARSPQSYAGIDPNRRTCIVRTPGNPWGHIVLRGGSTPNYHEYDIASVVQELAKQELPQAVMVDCSHGNSLKDYRRQSGAWNDVVRQKVSGNPALIGMMLESHLHEGIQPISSDRSHLKYGVSVTDACISWNETEKLLLSAHEILAQNMKANHPSA